MRICVRIFGLVGRPTIVTMRLSCHEQGCKLELEVNAHSVRKTPAVLTLSLSRQPVRSAQRRPPRGKVLTYDTIAECVKKCQYAVRGEIYLAATERIKAGKEVIFTNVGNPHDLGQKPLTFLRQVRDERAKAQGVYTTAADGICWDCDLRPLLSPAL